MYKVIKIEFFTKNFRYVLQFYKESKIEIEKKKEEAKKSILKVPETDLEISFECYFPTTMDIPKRPPWSPNMSRVELDLQENKYFRVSLIIFYYFIKITLMPYFMEL